MSEPKVTGMIYLDAGFNLISYVFMQIYVTTNYLCKIGVSAVYSNTFLSHNTYRSNQTLTDIRLKSPLLSSTHTLGSLELEMAY